MVKKVKKPEQSAVPPKLNLKAEAPKGDAGAKPLKRNHTRVTIITAIALLVGWATVQASTQHYIGKVISGKGASAEVASTQISYISARPPIGETEMYSPRNARIFMVDGWYCDQETFLAAVQPGQRLHLRNNRNQPITYGLYSTKPFAAEGIIIKTDPEARSVTVRHMLDKKQRKAKKQTYQLPADGLLRYEGKETTSAEALKKGRHVRAHPARKQTILAITPEAHLETVAARNKAWWTNLEKYGYTWVSEGYFAGHYHQWMFFTGEPFREGKGKKSLVNTCQRGASTTDSLFSSKALINGHFVTTAAAFRPGARALFVPDPIHSRQRASNVILHPTDDGHIEGRVKSLKEDKLQLLVTTCPTGRSRDLKRETVTIRLDDDAVYHLNGKPGAGRAETLRKGNTVRVLPAWSGAMLVRDLDGEKSKVSGYGLDKKLTARVDKPFTQDSTAKFHLRFGHVLFSPLSPAQYVDAKFTWKNGKVYELKLSNERFPGNWKSEGANLNFEIDGNKLTGSLEARFSGGTLTDHGRDGVYRFTFDGQIRNNVVIAQIKKITVDGTESSQIKGQHFGRLDRHLGGTVQVGPAEGKTGLYRLKFYGNKKKAFDPVVYLPRDKNGWGKGLAVFGGNRWGKWMAVGPSELKLSDQGLSGILRMKLTATLLKNVSRPQWKSYRISAGEAETSDDPNAPRYTGRYRTVFGRDPLLYLGPGGSIIRDAIEETSNDSPNRPQDKKDK